MNFRKYKKANKLLKQPYGINNAGDATFPISWAKARNWYNKGFRISFWNK